jgi:hypothetical protein
MKPSPDRPTGQPIKLGKAALARYCFVGSVHANPCPVETCLARPFEWQTEHPRRDRLTILRGQFTLIRTQAERGIPVSIEAIARAERLARELEAEELAA